MTSKKKATKLRVLSIELFNNALKEIQSHRQKASTSNDVYLISGEYLLLEAKEYVEATWEMIHSEKFSASLALSRWILEAALRFFWALGKKEEKEDKLKILAGEALRNEVTLQDNLAILWPTNKKIFQNNAKKASKDRTSLGVDKFGSLENRLKDIKPTNKTKWPNFYPLYRICCDASHPSLKVWKRFIHSDDTIIQREPKTKQDIALWMATYSIFYLVTFTYCLVELGDLDALQAWWEKEIRPLL